MFYHILVRCTFVPLISAAVLPILWCYVPPLTRTALAYLIIRNRHHIVPVPLYTDGRPILGFVALSSLLFFTGGAGGYCRATATRFERRVTRLSLPVPPLSIKSGRYFRKWFGQARSVSRRLSRIRRGECHSVKQKFVSTSVGPVVVPPIVVRRRSKR